MAPPPCIAIRVARSAEIDTWRWHIALERSGSVTPASSGVIVPASMSVTSPSIRQHEAARARDTPPPKWAPLIPVKRMSAP